MELQLHVVLISAGNSKWVGRLRPGQFNPVETDPSPQYVGSTAKKDAEEKNFSSRLEQNSDSLVPQAEF